jgi:5-methylthioribose kinase
MGAGAEALPVRGRFVGGVTYAPLDDGRLRMLVHDIPACRTILGDDAATWSIREVGDGNLNLVFIVESGTGGVVIKQALPYVRLVGESWPLPLDRSHFEHEALKQQAAHVPFLVPAIHHFEAGQAAIVMEYLSEHAILRKGLIRRVIYPQLADHLSTFLAEMLFRTSDLALPAHDKKLLQSLFCQNTALCKITEDLVFTDPYRVAPLNRWTSPQLDGIAAEFRSDGPLKIAVQELKWAFLSHGEALLHGDLHTGSVMVTPADTRVIDPEFAFFGPMGYDIGAVLANLMLNYLAQGEHPGTAEAIAEYRVWLVRVIEAVWTGFDTKFRALWQEAATGDAFAADLFTDPASASALDAHRKAVIERIFADSVGFAGAKMVRRVLGLAHVEDLETITDPDRRAACETRVLRLARVMMLERQSIRTISQLAGMLVAAAEGDP